MEEFLPLLSELPWLRELFHGITKEHDEKDIRDLFDKTTLKVRFYNDKAFLS